MAVTAVLLTSVCDVARADSGGEAAGHFRRGVALYNETDYRAALAEFKKAYSLAPNTAVLYDIGQTQYQLQDYAGALNTFEQYMAEAGGSAPHRSEVLSEMEVLRTRVGQLVVRAAAGAEVLVDDRLVGTTPLNGPVAVSIGARRVSVGLPGRVPVVRVVDVAAGERVPVSIELGEGGSAGGAKVVLTEEDVRKKRVLNMGITWGFTGVFAVSCIVVGALAISANHTLDDARNNYPETQADLDSKAKKSLGLAIGADILGAGAVAAGIAALYYTLHKPRPAGRHAAVEIIPTGNGLVGRF
jgi:hypothetical protein